MEKFEVLMYNQMLMSKIGIYSYHLTDQTNEFFKSFATYYMLFSVFVIDTAASAMGIYENKDNLELVLEATLTVIAGIQCGGMYLSIGFNMKSVKALHLILQGIVDEGQFPFMLNFKINS